MKKIGFYPATDWAPDFKTFGEVRGQPVLILVRFPLAGKSQTFLLDELIRFNGWSRSAGPLGWLYLGTPGVYQLPASLRDAQPGQRVTPRAVLYNDPQIAMNFRGIRSQSQALLDHSLCTDNWIYPDIRLYRNNRIVPMSIFNSNGKTPATIIFRRVSEAGLMKAVIRYWHASSMRQLAVKMLPLAERMDRWRRDLWSRVNGHPQAWRTSTAVRLDAAELQHGYAILTDTFIHWSEQRSRFSATGSRNLAAIKLQAKRFMEHLDDVVKATGAWVRYAQAKARAARTTSPTARKKILALEMVSRSRFMLHSNRQYLRYWRLKYHAISPTDPRHLWIKMIRAQYAGAAARNREATLGIAYGKAMATGDAQATRKASEAYEQALINAHIRALQILELQYEFRLSNDKGFVSKKHIAMLKASQKRLETEIAALKKELQQLGGNKSSTR
jgi:hypothetical protein